MHDHEAEQDAEVGPLLSLLGMQNIHHDPLGVPLMSLILELMLS